MTVPFQKVLQIWNPISSQWPPQWLCQEWLLIQASNCQEGQLRKQLMPWFGPKTETTEQKYKHAGQNGSKWGSLVICHSLLPIQQPLLSSWLLNWGQNFLQTGPLIFPSPCSVPGGSHGGYTVLAMSHQVVNYPGKLSKEAAFFSHLAVGHGLTMGLNDW